MKKRLLFRALIPLVLVAAALLSACGRAERAEPESVTAFMMDTIIEISLYGYDGNTRELLDGCVELCGNYEAIFSRTRLDSELYRLNTELAADGEAEVSDELASIIKASLFYSEISGGAFDITIGPVSALWDFTSGTNKIPDSAELENAVKLVSYKNVIVEGNTVKAPPGTKIDLGAIAKGFIADRLKEYLLDKGAGSAIINLGGNILCIGGLTEDKPFTIGVKKPFSESGEISAYLKIKNLSAVTSGPYERFFVRDDRLYHHILDTGTGYPVETELMSVTIISKSSGLCDAMSTACFALGQEKAQELIESMENVYALFIDAKGQITMTEGLKEAAEVTIE